VLEGFGVENQVYCSSPFSIQNGMAKPQTPNARESAGFYYWVQGNMGDSSMQNQSWHSKKKKLERVMHFS